MRRERAAGRPRLTRSRAQARPSCPRRTRTRPHEGRAAIRAASADYLAAELRGQRSVDRIVHLQVPVDPADLQRAADRVLRCRHVEPAVRAPVGVDQRPEGRRVDELDLRQVDDEPGRRAVDRAGEGRPNLVDVVEIEVAREAHDDRSADVVNRHDRLFPQAFFCHGMTLPREGGSIIGG